MGRTLKRWTRVYIDGFDMSGYTREVGPLSWIYPEIDLVSILDGVRGALPDAPEISIGTLNGLFDNTASVGIHAALGSAGVSRDVMIPIGIRAEPVAGNPVFMGAFNHNGYVAQPSGGDIVLTVPFGKTSPAELMTYDKPWGVLLHAMAARHAVNTAVGIDDLGAASAAGGWMMFQIFSVVGTGNVTLSVQDAATNADGSFALLSGATSGAIANTAVPTAGFVALSRTATVRRFLRWQIAFSGITSCTFALSFVRA